MITTFTALHDEMENSLRAAMPPVRTVDALRSVASDKVQTPAIFLGVDEMTVGKKDTSGRVAMNCIFNAYCLLSTKTPRAEVEVRNMAASLVANITGNRWNLPDAVMIPKGISATPGVFENDEAGTECWVVQWEQTVYLGSEWKPEDEVFDGFYLAGCHDELHKLPDFPEVEA